MSLDLIKLHQHKNIHIFKAFKKLTSRFVHNSETIEKMAEKNLKINDHKT